MIRATEVIIPQRVVLMWDHDNLANRLRRVRWFPSGLLGQLLRRLQTQTYSLRQHGLERLNCNRCVKLVLCANSHKLKRFSKLR